MLSRPHNGHVYSDGFVWKITFVKALHVIILGSKLSMRSEGLAHQVKVPGTKPKELLHVALTCTHLQT